MKYLFMSFAVCLTIVVSIILLACSDVCKDVDCGIYGTCDAADGKCVCVVGYETDVSERCDSLSITKFIGTYNVHDVCASGTSDYNVSISPSSTGVDKVVINNYGNYSAGSVLLETPATVMRNTLTISEKIQTFNNHSYHIYGTSATMMPDSTFTLTYKMDIDGILELDCVAVYHKQ